MRYQMKALAILHRLIPVNRGLAKKIFFRLLPYEKPSLGPRWKDLLIMGIGSPSNLQSTYLQELSVWTSSFAQKYVRNTFFKCGRVVVDILSRRKMKCLLQRYDNSKVNTTKVRKGIAANIVEGLPAI